MVPAQTLVRQDPTLEGVDGGGEVLDSISGAGIDT